MIELALMFVAGALVGGCVVDIYHHTKKTKETR